MTSHYFVVKLQVASAGSGFPAASFTPEAPPLTVTLYTEADASAALGCRVAVLLAAA